MAKTLLTSIIILNWNGKHHMDECLSSVLNQTYKNYEVILVDNGSTDGSQEYIASKYPLVNLICLPENYGFCKGNNIGIKAAKGEFIVLLNNDTVVQPDWLEQLCNAAVSNPTVGICASMLVSYYQKNLVDSAGDGFGICGAGFKRGHWEETSLFSKKELVFGACAGAALYKKEMLDKIGLLDEDFFTMYEDSDLSFRAQLAGYKCMFVPEAVVYHKVNSTLGTLSKFYVFYGQRNAEYVYFKNMPARLIPITIFQHLFYNILGFGYFTLKGRAADFIKAKIDFIRHLPEVLRKRKRIMAQKTVSDAYILSILERKWLRSRLKGK